MSSYQAIRSKAASSLCKDRPIIAFQHRPDSQSYLIKKNFCKPSHNRKIVTSEAPMRNFWVTSIL